MTKSLCKLDKIKRQGTVLFLSVTLKFLSERKSRDEGIVREMGSD